MTKRNAITAALLALLVVSHTFSTPRVAAQAPPEPALGLVVDPALVAPGSLRVALEAELGVAVQELPAATGQMPTISVVRLGSGNVEVSLQSRSVPRASREIALSSELAGERVETLALVAANLVRNEAASLLPDLRPLAAPPPPPKPAEPDPCDLHGEAAFGIDFAPGVGNSSTRSGRAATRRVSLGFAGTLSSRLHGLGFSFGANIQTVSACGFQFAAANIVRGPMTGAQFGYGVNLTVGTTTGVQSALLNLSTGEIVGVQSGVVNFARRGMRGVGVGAVNFDLGHQYGVQVGALNFVGRESAGLQVGAFNYAGGERQGVQAGVLNLNIGGVRGLQAGVSNLATGDSSGLQVSVFNLTTADRKGVEIGVANITSGEVRGLQAGVLNYAERSDVSIGVLSIQRRGRTSIDALGSVESGTLLAGVTHGGRFVHNSYGVGLRTGREGQRLVVSLGLGVRALRGERLWLDIDAFSQQVLRENSRASSTQVYGLRAPVTLVLGAGFGVVAAPTYQVMVTDDAAERTQSSFGDSTLKDGRTRVLGYPGLMLGLRWQIDHGL